MKTSNSQSRAYFNASVASAVLGLALISGPAFAQASKAPADETSSDTIIVTGSRIARANVESSAPVTVIGAEEIKENGSAKIEDLTNSLPQVFAGQNSGVSNGADGTATIDLRGLGPSRTVVLVDGRRLMPGNIGGGAAADLNFIPSALVSSVELLTGGASATYGADAVAGVVNFKMNRHFKGLRVDAQYSLYQHSNGNPIASIVNQRYTAPVGSTVNGGAFDATIAIGTGFSEDRGSIVAYAGYREEQAITQDKYDYSICSLNADGQGSGAGIGFACGGSGTPAQTRFGGFSVANKALAGITGSTFTLTKANTLIPYVGLRDAFNFAPLNYFRRPSKRYTAGAFAEYQLSDAFKPYMDVMFADYSTKAQIAPSGAFFGTRVVNCDNPLLLANDTVATAACGANKGTATNATILIGKRNVEGGPRFNDLGFNQFRIVIGGRGDISDAWSYDAYAQFGQIKYASTYRNDVSSARINRALQVVSVNGLATCKSVVDGSDPACVPYNVFADGGVSAGAAGYIGIPLVLTGTTKESIMNGSVSGDLGKMGFKSPFSDEGVKVVFGAEYRKEQLATQPDLSYINGDGAGQGGPTLPIAGSFTATDFFTEASLPIATDKAFFHDLALDVAYRHSSYKVPGAAQQNSTDTYKIEGAWSPIKDIKFRGSYNRAVRSPNIGQLFANQSFGLFGGSDPCAGAAVGGLVNGNTAAQCARTGVTAAQFGNILANSAGQYNQYTGGSLNVKPEKADTYTFGVLLQPQSFLHGLTFSADYFHIKVNGAIGTPGAQVSINQCLATGNPDFCNLIHRGPAGGPAAGSLWINGPSGGSITDSGYVSDQTTNTGSVQTSGVDFNGDYRTTLGENKIRLQFVGTYLDKYKFQPFTGGFAYNCAGFYGSTCGNPNPKFRFNTNAKFTMANDIALTVRWRYFSGVKVDTISPDPNLNVVGNATVAEERFPAVNYFDLLLALPIKDTIKFRIGVNNIFDKDPPLVSSSSTGGFANGNTFPGTYDHLGRYAFVNLTADF